MPLTVDQIKIKNECLKLPLSTAHLSDEYYYDNLPLCVIDAVFSIGVRYTSTRNTVENYCNNQKLKTRVAPPPSIQSDSYKIDDLINAIQSYADYGAEEVFSNTQKTSSKNGMLKAKAVLEFATVLKNNNIQTLSDIRNADKTVVDKIEKEIRKIKGQKSGISYSYFLMLSGDDNHMKIDRWLLRFVNNATGKTYNTVSAEADLKVVCNALQKHGFSGLKPRILDHEIWKFMK